MEQDTRAGADSAGAQGVGVQGAGAQGTGDGAWNPGPPIYDGLVGEQGDVASEARQAAEHTQRTAGEVLDFHRPQPSPELADGDAPQGPAAPQPAPFQPEGAPKPAG